MVHFQLLTLVCAGLMLAPAALLAQAGPDASMATHSAVTGIARPERAARLPGEPGATERPRTAENGRPDVECDSHGAGGGDEAGHGDARADRARCHALSDADIATAPIVEVRRVTHHQGVIGGHPLTYTATAGTLTIRDDEGKPTASMFYVAYTLGGARRPVTFFYNGGPGSSTLWPHMGSLSPVRVVTDSPQATHNAPFDLVANNDSLLDRSDLVFLDAVGAGYSRPLGDTKLAAFWGTDQDIDAFA
ncbi:MAG TPA: hypothetical protein VIB82_07925, partial [Caulobacteraceae bacterium]